MAGALLGDTSELISKQKALSSTGSSELMHNRQLGEFIKKKGVGYSRWEEFQPKGREREWEWEAVQGSHRIAFRGLGLQCSAAYAAPPNWRIGSAWSTESAVAACKAVGITAFCLSLAPAPP
jgi:hypothetical protein